MGSLGRSSGAFGRFTAMVAAACAVALGACTRAPDHVAPAVAAFACYDCHGDLYLATRNPDHVAADIGRVCETCHTTTAWRPATIVDHPYWPLTGAHAAATCEGCHGDGRFTGTPRECVGCHRDDFVATTNPDHVAGGFVETCETCHDDRAWRPAAFDHATVWPLVGAHAAATCTSCHADGDYANTPTTCDGCHHDDWVASVDPDHEALALSTTCESCHTPAAWHPADFAVHDRYWPLAGAHTGVACESCHAGGRFGGTPTACEGCHMADYDATTNPDHGELALPTACAGCHVDAAWRPASFDAHDRFWPLDGRHDAVACTACHSDGTFSGTARACEGCHLDDAEATDDPDHVALELTNACGGCHTTEGWRPATFAAHDRFWPIAGAHTGVACASCHVDGEFAGTPRACEGCHQADYDRASDPDHAALELPTACAGCHTESGWQPAGFAVHDRLWPLTGRHAEATCEGCHTGDTYAGTATTCEGCHQDDYDASTDPPHAAAGFPKDCTTCHDTLGWSPSVFEHDDVWPIDGKHEAVACASCHVGAVYAGTARACSGCHLEDYQATTDPDHAALGFPTGCEGCHQTAGWTPAGLSSHDRFWPLVGAHASASCESCHAGGVFAGTARTCVGCHRDDYDATTAPAHAALAYPTACETCHGSAAWRPSSFDHAAHWPLVGAHASASCDGCHAGGVYAGTAKACASCHLDDYQATRSPAHAALGYPTACETCHDSAAWSSSTFDHAAVWPLAGKHAAATCTSCHGGGVFAGTSRECAACHQDDYDATEAPAHDAAGFSTRCEGCHTASGWAPATFDHTAFWPLTGRHAAATCEGCHRNDVFAGTTKVCQDCHLDDYTRSVRPAHAAEGYPKACETCHTTAGWRPATFDHALHWPLTGQHASTTCSACHAGDVFAGTPTTCESCHLDRYLATTTPDHESAGFSRACESCHATSAWTPATFDHNAFWPLTGRHLTARCEDCHGGGTYAGTARTCSGCHMPDFRSSDDPDHELLGLSTNCVSCHGTTSWEPSTFDHDWPLAGRHASASCEACHGGGVTDGTPTECVGCHRADYDATTAPDHAAGGFPLDCADCHGASAWRPSTFVHDAVWPLTGAHDSAACESCHVGGVFAGTPRTCVACHRADYDATTQPDHAAAGYPTACESCHATSAWRPATFEHDAFWPLTGAHDSAACESCHVGGVFAGTPTTCVACHRGDYDATTQPDHAAVGYPTSCEGCHATSAWRPASFDHAVFWPLTGAHSGAACESCHSGGVYDGTPTACVGCHQSDYQSADNPSHAALGLATTCQTCHTTASWATTTFPGHNALFPITSGAHRRFGCVDCHTTSTWSDFTCTGCHTGEHTLARTNNQHDEVGGYQGALTTYGVDGACYHCHPDGRGDD